jgi:HEPN domain-containing protein
MNIEQRLNDVAERYKAQGYRVIVQPDRNALPTFAKDFKVEILATREDSNVLALAKGNSSELEADPNVPRYAEITNQQPGWRLDVFVLGPDSQVMPKNLEAKEPPEEDIRRFLDDIEPMLQAGFTRASLIAAWSALEAAMRRRLREEGEEAEWGTSPRTMLNELYSAGAISTGVLRELEAISNLRNAIVHGFLPSVVVDENVVQFLVHTARHLLTESQLAKQPA